MLLTLQGVATLFSFCSYLYYLLALRCSILSFSVSAEIEKRKCVHNIFQTMIRSVNNLTHLQHIHI